ncbi:hypothetical protein LJC29_05120 [Bacteroides sp. OttesenSCG-928-N06]|nr:hypothetical protein [Bacteroides sp. OttesenSCG-928-N06]
MERNKSVRGIVILLIAITLIAGWGGFWLLHQSGNSFAAYPIIPFYFFVWGVGYVFVVQRALKQPPQRTIMLFIGARMFKLLLSILLLVVYGMLANAHLKEFILTFLAFYLIYMLLEIGIFYGLKADKKEIEAQ